MKKLILLAFLCVAAQIIRADVIVVSTDAEIRAAISDNALIQLGTDIELSNSTLEIPSNNTVTMDLNGHKLDRKLIQRGQGGGTVITVRSGATLTLSNGTLRGGWAGVGGALSNEGGSVTINNVILTGCKADNAGGGICNRAGTLTMNGGAITDNISRDIKVNAEDKVGGGGIFNAENATLNLNNVTITGNETELYGGGGICNYGTLNLNSCSITGNIARSVGGGLWSGNERHKLRMQGANTITGNTASGNVSNLYLMERRLITCTGSLIGSRIGVSLDLCPNMFTADFVTYHSGDDFSSIFVCDRPEMDSLALVQQQYATPGEVIMQSRVKDHWVPYVEHSWDSENQQLLATIKMLKTEIGWNETTTSDTQYKRLHTTDEYLHLGDPNSTLHEYYVVMDEEVSIDGMVVDGPNVHIILCDHAWLHLEREISVYEGSTVYIHAQSSGTYMGRFTNDDVTGHGGIGGSRSESADPDIGGNIQIHGGYLNLRGNDMCATIGGNFDTRTGDISIFDGRMILDGGSGAAAIGGGSTCQDYGNITIYGGVIEAMGGTPHAVSPAGGAGIGGGTATRNGKLTIWGGHITAYGGNESGGIGGAQMGGDYGAGTITIHGGVVKAYGDDYGAGIGGGDGKPGGTLIINGGHVEAYGGTDAAGIGGGEGGSGGYVTINGGYVHAQGNDWGAGIGGGEDGAGATVAINGGIVIAKAGRNETGCRAIGPGEGSDDYGSLTLGDDLMVSSERRAAASERKSMCWYRTQVRVEPCDHSEVTYTVDGYTATDHHTAHCVYCNHSETELHSFDEHGVCTVCGVKGEVKALILWEPKAQADGSFDGETYHPVSTHRIVPNTEYVLPMATLNVPGYTFIGWEVNSHAKAISYTSPYTEVLTDTLYRAGDRYTVTDHVTFVARYKVSDINLYDDQPNGEVLAQYDGMKVNKVTLSGRVFNKNNTWQPLALPFALSAEELAASPLAGCVLKELDTDSSYYDAANKLVYLYFKDATAIEAGKPYIIRWAEGNPILSPEFTSVTLTNKTADAKGRLLMYKSIYSPQTFASANKTVIYFNEDGVLVHPKGDSPVTVGACRAYFRLTNLMGGESDAEFTITTNIDLPEGLDPVTGNPSPVTLKLIKDGLLYIDRNGRLINVLGQPVR